MNKRFSIFQLYAEAIAIQRMDTVSQQMSANANLDIPVRHAEIVNRFPAARTEFVRSRLSADVCLDGQEFYARLVNKYIILNWKAHKFYLSF